MDARRFSPVARTIAVLIALLLSGECSAAVLGPGLAEWRERAEATALESVVVTFHGDAAGSAHAPLLRELGLTGFHFRALPMAGVLATPAQLRALQADPRVRSIWRNEPLVYTNRDSTELTGVNRLRADAALRSAEGLPYSGRGIGVVINDSGVDGTHPDLQFPQHLVQNVTAITSPAAYGNLVNDPDIEALIGDAPVDTGGLFPVLVSENIPNTDSTGSHGTHVAGIVGATGQASAGKYAGVAPGANLIGYGSGAGLLVLDGLGGFDWTLANQARYNIRVINNSFGSPSDIGTPFNPDHPFAVASKKLADRGVVVVFAAGNFFDEDSLGGSWVKAPWIIVAGAGDRYGRLADFSSRGAFGQKPYRVTVDGERFVVEDRPTVIAPGAHVISTKATSVDPVALTGVINTDEVENFGQPNVSPAEAPFYIAYTGTSMAAPHTAGVVALMLEANPALGWREVRHILQRTATAVPGRGSWEVGAGYLNAHAAVRMAAGLAEDYGAYLPLFTAPLARLQTPLLREQRLPVAIAPGSPAEAVLEVGAETTRLAAWAVAGQGAVNLALTGPQGQRVVSPIFSQPVLDPGLSVMAVAEPGSWTVSLEEPLLSIIGFPQLLVPHAPGTVEVRLREFGGRADLGLRDLADHPEAGALREALRLRLIDAAEPGRFRPERRYTRLELARSLAAAGLRQPAVVAAPFVDVAADQQGLVAALTLPGGALRDRSGVQAPLLELANPRRFRPDAALSRLELAHALIQALGLQAQAEAHQGGVSALVEGSPQPVADVDTLSDRQRGDLQLALDRGLLRVTVSDGGVRLRPTDAATRAEAALALLAYQQRTLLVAP